MKRKEFSEFAAQVLRAKRVTRLGWRKAGVPNPESIADHMYSMAVLGMLLSDMRGLDTAETLRMVLLHDLQEVTTGDWTPQRRKKMGVGQSRKLEFQAFRAIISRLPRRLARKYSALWMQVQKGKTGEARLAADLDSFEMGLQAYAYSIRHPKRRSLEALWRSAVKKTKDPWLRAVLLAKRA